jgi:hypothetical protein
MITSKLQRTLIPLAVLLVGTALALGFFVVGSPSGARLQKFDDRRVENLRVIHGAIQRMVIKRVNGKIMLNRALPTSLEEVAAYVASEQNQKGLNLHDPSTNEPYVYRVKSETKYELGATFALPRNQKEDLFWNHPAGPHCFVFDAVEDESKRPVDYYGPRWP